MQTIFIPKVLEELTVQSDSRSIGWFETPKEALEGLHNFGDECRWAFALIEEVCPGMHGSTHLHSWYKYGSEGWEEIEDEEVPEGLRLCINHTLG